jgi:hypothetical protein
MTKKITSILLALFFLVSSSHLSFATHYCGGKAFKHALLLSASDLGCGMEKGNNDCEKTAKVKNNCCTTLSFLISIKGDFQQVTTTISPDQQIIALVAANLFFNILLDDATLISYQDYKPPLPDKNIPILFQSFLI